MSKITALMPDQSAADHVASKLALLNISGLDWRIIDGEVEDHRRVMPAVAAPLGDGTRAGGVAGPVGLPLVADLPEREVFTNKGEDQEDAEYYGRTVEHGAIAIVIDVPSEHEQHVRGLLQEANAQQISVE